MFIFIAICVIIILSAIQSCIRPKNYPKGPLFLPIIGSCLSLPAKGTEFKIQQWRKKYGNIIGHKLGYSYLVIVSGSDEIIEGLKHPNLQGRIHSKFFMERSFFKLLGFFFSDDETWSEVRRFTLRYFGQVFNAPLEAILHDEMLEEFSTIQSGKITNIDGPFMKSPLVVIMKILTGSSRKEYKHELDDIQRKTEVAFQLGRVSGIEVVYPSLRRFFHNDALIAARDATHNFIKDRLEERKRSFNPLDIKDYLDSFLLQQKKELDTYGSINHYSDEELISCAFDMVQAGTESTGKTIKFILLYVSMNKQIQDKIHEEIDQIVGRTRYPQLQDKPNMPYVEATIYEGMRINPIAPMGVVHRATEDTKFRGYDLKKDTLLYFALKDQMNDPEEWNNPNEFMPERFLDTSRASKKLVNFGLGKRSCVGEVLVKNFMFLYVTYFFQKFSIKLPRGYEPSTEPILGITNSPKPFKLIITERSQ